MTRLLTTIGNLSDNYPERSLEVRRLPRRQRGTLLRQLVHDAPAYDASVLFGAAGFREGYVDLVAAGILGRRGLPVVLTECYWEASSRSISRLRSRPESTGFDAAPRTTGLLARSAVRLVDSPKLHYCVLSSDEERAFPEAWGVPAWRVHFTPFCFMVDVPPPDAGPGTTIFAGGDSLRDYRALISAAATADAPVVIATRLGERRNERNLRVGPLPTAEYDAELRNARVVVVPLRDNTLRSAGQQTYLAAMALGKPLVVTDSPGVRDYVRHGETGLIVPPNDPQRLAETLRWLLDDLNEPSVRAMVAQARATALATYTLRAYHDRLLDVVVSLLGSLG